MLETSSEAAVEAASGLVRVPVSVSEGGRLPRYATSGAAGLDLCSAEDLVLAPMERRCVRTGVRLAIPPGFEGQVRPRSGLALRMGIGMVNSVGTIDSDYRGDIGILLINFGADVVKISRGERIAQLVISPVVQVQLVEVEEVPQNTVRGEGGFGSTGSQ